MVKGRGAKHETPQEREARIAWEREALERGREDILAGRSISGAELDAVLERFVQGTLPDRPDTDNEVPTKRG